MDADHTDPTFQTPKERAGPHYEEMMRSKEAALEYLSSPNYRVRLAAIMICQTTWNCGSVSELVEACREIAGSDADDSFRLCSIGSLRTVLSSSKAPDISRFLANLVMDSINSMEVRTCAYWALREIQFGIGDVDFDTFLKSVISTCVKPILFAYPERFSEDDVRRNLTPQPGFPEDFWDSAEEIDWDFVRQFARPS